MNELPDNNYDEARRWFRNVAADLHALEAVLADPDAPGRICCFLAHLVVEKALKATLIDAGVPFKKTHNLLELQAMCAEAGRLVDLDTERLARLNPWAIDGRYADEFRDAARAMAHESVALARGVVNAVARELEVDRGDR
jgi:HEPN domain-containing protein